MVLPEGWSCQCSACRRSETSAKDIPRDAFLQALWSLGWAVGSVFNLCPQCVEKAVQKLQEGEPDD